MPDWGVRTPALASGAGRRAVRGRVRALRDAGDPRRRELGAASARKLARSVFTKGLAAAMGESLEAARRLGCEDWLYANIESSLNAADGRLLRRLVEGSRRHAGRRVRRDGGRRGLLEELGVEPRVAAASEAWLRSLVGSEAAR